ncbi:DUF3794 domain-containing protein [Oceanobacillus rekensis]|uniref:DUF3794 domain-containing protein n=1 Tax=Oceanobacillus rekensis TaxID=937927 RepID=UPI00111DBBCC|nr:DUF3794 domain-containing protein [Oceanobacillus rekensis]
MKPLISDCTVVDSLVCSKKVQKVAEVTLPLGLFPDLPDITDIVSVNVVPNLAGITQNVRIIEGKVVNIGIVPATITVTILGVDVPVTFTTSLPFQAHTDCPGACPEDTVTEAPLQIEGIFVQPGVPVVDVAGLEIVTGILIKIILRTTITVTRPVIVDKHGYFCDLNDRCKADNPPTFVLPALPALPIGNGLLDAVNDAETVEEMRAAIEDPSLGLDLTIYETLSEAQKNQVAEIILENRPQRGYTSVQSVQGALNNAVEQVTVDPNNIYVESGSTGGDGSRANPFGTIEEGMAAVNTGGIVHILEGIYNVDTQLIINKSLTLQGEGEVRPQVVFSSSNTMDGLVIQADNVTVDNLHLISNRALTGTNAVFSVPLRTPDNLYANITIKSSIIEGTVRSGYMWVENMTLLDNIFIHNAPNTQSLRFQMVRGTTNVLNNTFQGGSTSVGAVIFEPNLASYTVSGTINVTGNTMTSFTQFVNFYSFLEGSTSLFIEDNSIDHQDKSGSSVILTTRVNYALVEDLLIQNNTFINPHPTRLAVYFAGGGGGNNIPSEDQIKVYDNTFNFPNGYGQRPGDVVDPVYPVGYNAEAASFGMTLDAFDLQGNMNI